MKIKSNLIYIESEICIYKTSFDSNYYVCYNFPFLPVKQIPRTSFYLLRVAFCYLCLCVCWWGLEAEIQLLLVRIYHITSNFIISISVFGCLFNLRNRGRQSIFFGFCCLNRSDNISHCSLFYWNRKSRIKKHVELFIIVCNWGVKWLKKS